MQLISAPILVNSLGLEAYGAWLLLSTVPIYLVLSDLGLVNAATNEMTIRYAAGDHNTILSIFQSVLVVVTVLFSTVTIVSVFFVALGIFDSDAFSLAAPKNGWVIPILTGYATCCMLSMVAVAVLRASGQYARGTLLYDVSTLFEAVATLFVIAASRNLVWGAATSLALRMLALPIIYWQMRRFQPGISIGLSHVDMQTIRSLLPAALSVLAIPVGLAISLQGTSLVIGVALGAAAVAIFVPVRTASRMAVSIAGIVSRALIPEIAAARGRGDRNAELRYWRINSVVRWSLLCPASLLFGLFGVRVVEIWTGGAISPPPAVVWLMALTIVLHGSWYLNTSLLTASHDHIALAPSILAICLTGLIVSYALMPTWHLAGAATGLLVTDALLAVAVALKIRKIRQVDVL